MDDTVPGSGAGEPTECPHCRRSTRTVASGACAECWQAKTPEGRGVFQDRGAKTERLLDFDFGLFEISPLAAWGLVTTVAVALIALAVRALIS